LAHPDLHFIFPTASGDGEGSSVKTSDDYLVEFRDFLDENPFPLFKNWASKISANKKSLIIGVKEASNVLEKLALKSHSGKYKIIIIWLPEKLNNSAANRLLKTIEEPQDKTLILLITENVSNILPTIKSRCQVLSFPPMEHNVLSKWIKDEYDLSNERSEMLASLSEGQPGVAINYLKNNEELRFFSETFASSMRISFKKDFTELNKWVEKLSLLGRDQIIDYCCFSSSLFSLLVKHKFGDNNAIALDWFDDISFKTDSFAKLIETSKLSFVLSSLDSAKLDIQRNLNAKIVLFDMGVKLMSIF
jgi:DNA polymerase-3 subunit delta'